MDNLQRFYRARYKTAEDHAKAGENAKCLDILWDLRLQPDISLYRRALVNLLIACTADVRQHPDKSKFAQECIDLVAQVRRNGLADDQSEIELQKMERHAEQTLKGIELQIKEVEAWKAEKAAKMKAKSGEETTESATIKESSTKNIGSAGEDVDMESGEEAEESLEQEAVSGWTIEGMYSDFLIGKRSEDKIVQKESRFETPPPDGSVSEQTVVQKNPLLLHTPPQSSPNQEETIARKKLEQLNNPYSSSPLREHKK